MRTEVARLETGAGVAAEQEYMERLAALLHQNEQLNETLLAVQQVRMHGKH